MLNNNQSALLGAVSKLLKPLVKILLKRGIDYGTVAEVMRKTYVDMASDGLKENHKRPTVSSISAITGLTRKEVKRLKEIDTPNSQEAHKRYNRSIRVISGWLNDSRFLNENNSPKHLPIEGEEGSFTDLVRGYSGDIPASTMLSVLQNANTVDFNNGHVELLQHAYIPEDNDVEKIDILGADVAELIGTINHNLSCAPNQRVFQRKVSNHRIKAEAVSAFKALAFKKSQKLLEELDSFLSLHESTDEPGSYVALGIYYNDDPQSHRTTETKL